MLVSLWHPPFSDYNTSQMSCKSLDRFEGSMLERDILKILWKDGVLGLSAKPPRSKIGLSFKTEALKRHLGKKKLLFSSFALSFCLFLYFSR